MVPAFSTSCLGLIDRWKKLVSPQGSHELDVAVEIQNLAGGVIARTGLGAAMKREKEYLSFRKSKLNWCSKPIRTYTSQVSGTMPIF